MKITDATTAREIEAYHARTRALEAEVSEAATAHRVSTSRFSRGHLLAAIDRLNAHIGVVHQHDFAS